ncbi:hypothetical protein ACWPKO_05275 [Coraliomargarita sp. W4R53]
MFRFTSICLLLLFSSLVLPADEVVDYLKRYEGRWVGDFTIHSTATGYNQTFPVEQRYWWEDGQLHGISVSETDSGIQTAKSRTFIQDGELESEVTQGETSERFFGVLHDTGIVWLPEDPKRVTDYQMTEAFVTEDGQLLLNTDGFDRYVYQDGLAHLVYRGRLVRQLDEDQ